MNDLTIVLLFTLVFVLGVAWLSLHPEFGTPPRREWAKDAPNVWDADELNRRGLYASGTCDLSWYDATLKSVYRGFR